MKPIGKLYEEACNLFVEEVTIQSKKESKIFKILAEMLEREFPILWKYELPLAWKESLKQMGWDRTLHLYQMLNNCTMEEGRIYLEGLQVE